MQVSNRTAKSIRNISSGYIKQVFILILSFSTKTIFIRLLGAEYLGINGLYSNILTILSLAELGVGNVLVYSLYKPLHEEDKATICRLINYFKKVYRMIAISITILGIALIPFLRLIINSGLQQNELVIYYLLYLANSVCSYLVVYKSTLIQADQKIYINNLCSLIFMIIQYVGQIVYLLVTNNFIGYLIIQVICTLLSNIVMNFIANRMYPYINDKSLQKETNISFTALNSDIKAMFIYKMSNVIVNNTDNILISIILGTIVVGYYSNYYSLMNYVSLFINLTITGLMASLGNLNSSGDWEKSYQMFKNQIFIFNILGIFVVSCFSTVVQDFICLWIGSKYLLGTDVIFAILFTFYFNCVTNPVWMYRETMGLFRQIRCVVFMTAIINLILSIVLGEKIGLAGILLATGISRLATTGWYEPILLYKSKFHKNVLTYFIQQGKYLAINSIILILCIFICGFLPGSLQWIVCKVFICATIVGVGECLFYRNTNEFIFLKSKMINIFNKKTLDSINN